MSDETIVRIHILDFQKMLLESQEEVLELTVIDKESVIYEFDGRKYQITFETDRFTEEER